MSDGQNRREDRPIDKEFRDHGERAFQRVVVLGTEDDVLEGSSGGDAAFLGSTGGGDIGLVESDRWRRGFLLGFTRWCRSH